MADRRRTIRWDLAVTLAAAALSLYSLGAVMRETDQASLLDGALSLAKGNSSIFGSYSYNYDKQFVSYWLLSAVLKAGSLCGMEFDFRHTVFAGNLFAWLVFWAGMIFLVARRGKGNSGSALLIGGTLFSPIVLLYSSLLCPNVISGGFLAVLAGQVGGRKPIGRADAVVAGALTFLAVGARADAVLCLPFLCWLTTRRPVLRALVTSRRHWAMFFGAIAALGVGYLVSTGSKIYVHPLILMPSVIAAYLVFGFGGGFAMFLAMCGALGARVRMAGGMERKRFYLAGLVFAFLPLAYFGFQLYTPRHLMTTAWLVMFFATAWRGAAMIRSFRKRRFSTALLILFLATGLAPLFVGLRIPALDRPQPVMAGATRFPTTDGHFPMGAVLDFLGKQRRAVTEPIDHNQALWSALATVDFDSVDGIVPVYGTPLLPYFQLAANLRGARAKNCSLQELGALPFLYGDERMLKRSTRTVGKDGDRMDAFLKTLRRLPKTVVSDPAYPQAILRVVPGDGRASDPDVESRLALATVFAGNEFDVTRGAIAKRREMMPSEAGRMTVFFSDEPFEIVLVARGGGERRLRAEAIAYEMPSGEERAMQIVAVGAEETLDLRERIVARQAAPVHAARAVFPGYMAVGNL